ncbi:MAG: hypothetical protein NC311_17760 [Muribaculaceae bacterium]|nr:hypothetical protein [Muribaculaceae bacterium]
MNIKVFHGTDYNLALQIQDSEFVVKKSDSHWLGNGIYFYVDEALAKWWTTNPTEKFGSSIKDPAIIRSTISIDNSRILDLRKRDDYERFIRWEDEFNRLLIENRNDDLDWHIYRCALFDSIFNYKDIDMIIGCFDANEQPYISEAMFCLLKKLHLAYPEVQVCIKPSSQKYIKIIEINRARSGACGSING